MPIKVGDRTTHEFVVTSASMRWFQEVAQDTSRIHTDEAFARSRGFDGVIAYGGIMLAHLSHVLGMKLPGRDGTSAHWSITYRKPLYVDEPAQIELEVVRASKATGFVRTEFKITAGDKTVATGTAESVVPLEEIGQ